MFNEAALGMTSVRLVAHVIRKRMKSLTQERVQLVRHPVLGQRAIHAPEPLIALARPDPEREMPHAKARVAVAVRIERWAAGPHRQVEVQLVARRLETRGVERANRRRFRRRVHEIVEAIHEPTHAGVAAELLVWCRGIGVGRRHASKVHSRHDASRGFRMTPNTPPHDDIPLDSTERDLGLDVPITRRDFLNSTLLASGAALLHTKAPFVLQSQNAAWEGPGGVGDYARSHGNMWSAVTTAHELRDGTLGGESARRQAADTGERYDLIVVGGGLSGLGAAYYYQKLRGGRVLVLDNHPMVGGEAKRNEFNVDGVRLIGPQGSNDFGTGLPSGWAGDYWKDLGLPHGAESFEHQAWGDGVKPLEIPRD